MVSNYHQLIFLSDPHLFQQMHMYLHVSVVTSKKKKKKNCIKKDKSVIRKKYYLCFKKNEDKNKTTNAMLMCIGGSRWNIVQRVGPTFTYHCNISITNLNNNHAVGRYSCIYLMNNIALPLFCIGHKDCIH